MAELIFSDAFLAIGAYDVAPVTKGLPFKWSQEIKEWICFKPIEAGTSDPLTRKRLPGAESAELPVDGYLDFGSNWLQAQADLGVSNTILTFGLSRTPGSLVYLFPAVMAESAFGGPTGDVVPFAATYQSNGVICPGKLFDFGPAPSGPGEEFELEEVAADANLYAHLHSVMLPGGTAPTEDVILESSAAGDFSDAVTRATFTQLTTRGKERKVIPGPITDTTYRFNYTGGGTGSPVFVIRSAAGVR